MKALKALGWTFVLIGVLLLGIALLMALVNGMAYLISTVGIWVLIAGFGLVLFLILYGIVYNTLDDTPHIRGTHHYDSLGE